MRRIKKIFVTFLAICMICPCLSVITEAATAELRFADPSTTVGAEVDVKTKLTSASSMQSMEATLTYDKSELDLSAVIMRRERMEPLRFPGPEVEQLQNLI